MRGLAASHPELAVLAVGGYGREELCLYSDIDLLLLHHGPASPEAVRSILYPLWDAGLKVGHATRSVKATLSFAREDHRTLCALLSARHLSGPADMTANLELGITRLLGSLKGSFGERLAAEERAVWAGEPFAVQNFDLKNGRGGLRSLHRLEWDRKRAALLGEKPHLAVQPQEEHAGQTLVEVRQALHAVQRRSADTFALELRSAVGGWLGRDPLEVATEVYQAARTIDGFAALRWGQVRPAGADPVAHAGLSVVRLVRSRWGRREPMVTPLVFATAATASQSGGRLSVWESEFAHRAGAPDWSEGDRAGLLALLASGETGWQAILGLWESGWLTRSLPELAHVRGLAQAAPFHRHPVDAHLGATVASVVEIAGAGNGWLGEIAERLGSLDEVLLAAWLHDVGKGLGGDHSEQGSRLAASTLGRLGFAPPTVKIVGAGVRHHLLLPDTAARRDIADPRVVRELAHQIGNVELLLLLTLLSAADGRATGTDMWSAWKETLLRTLVEKLEPALAGTPSELEAELIAELESQLPDVASSVLTQHLGTMPAGYLTRFGAELAAVHFRLLSSPPEVGDIRTAVIGGAPISTLVVVTRDRPSLLATVAGVLSLRNLNVVEARAVTRADGIAIDTFRVTDALGSDMIGPGRWPAIRDELASAMRGEGDLAERIAAKGRSYRTSNRLFETDVRVEGRFIDVRTGDRVGLLHDLAAAMASLGIEVQLAKIDTRGGEAIDVFEVVNPNNQPFDAIRAVLLRAVGP